MSLLVVARILIRRSRGPRRRRPELPYGTLSARDSGPWPSKLSSRQLAQLAYLGDAAAQVRAHSRGDRGDGGTPSGRRRGPRAGPTARPDQGRGRGAEPDRPGRDGRDHEHDDPAGRRAADEGARAARAAGQPQDQLRGGHAVGDDAGGRRRPRRRSDPRRRRRTPAAPHRARGIPGSRTRSRLAVPPGNGSALVSGATRCRRWRAWIQRPRRPRWVRSRLDTSATLERAGETGGVGSAGPAGNVVNECGSAAAAHRAGGLRPRPRGEPAAGR